LHSKGIRRLLVEVDRILVLLLLAAAKEAEAAAYGAERLLGLVGFEPTTVSFHA